jgi:hypothetical protein
MRSGLAFMRRALVAAQEAGDLTYATFACYDLIAQLLPSGDPLEEVQRETENALELAKKGAVRSNGRRDHWAARAHPDPSRADAGVWLF